MKTMAAIALLWCLMDPTKMAVMACFPTFRACEEVHEGKLVCVSLTDPTPRSWLHSPGVSLDPKAQRPDPLYR